jgi:hypothetical protein
MKTKIHWDKLTKNDYIRLVKAAYQHPGTILMIDFDEYRVDYDKNDWKKLFSKYQTEDWVVTDEEKDFYNKLGDKLTVYRADNVYDTAKISWTTNIHVARYFMNEHNYSNVYEREINKADIKCVLLDMDEDELIII